MRANRLISLILLLQSRGHATAAELAGELGVSVRTVYRDLEALGSAGIPVTAERGPGGGCRLLGGYRTQLTGLDRGEAEALFLSGLPGPVAELGLGSLLARAQTKVLAALPARMREAARLAGERFHLDARGWFQPQPAHPALEALATAVWSDRRVRFDYTRGDGREVEREADALALTLKAGLWYLVARVDDQVRVYRVSRIGSVGLSEASFARDPAFHLEAFWADWSERFESSLDGIPVTVRVAPGAQPRVEAMGDPIVRAPADPPPTLDGDGWLRRILVFERLEYARSALLGFAGDVEVIAPNELRTQMAVASRALAELYGGSGARSQGGEDGHEEGDCPQEDDRPQEDHSKGQAGPAAADRRATGSPLRD